MDTTAKPEAPKDHGREPERFIPFNVLLPPSVKEKLDKHARDTHTSVAHIVRTALMSFVAHSIDQEPTCANGVRCLAPQYWSRTGSAE